MQLTRIIGRTKRDGRIGIGDGFAGFRAEKCMKQVH